MLSLHTSAEVLQPRIESWFKKNFPGQNVHFFEAGDKIAPEGAENFVIFGDFIFAASELIAHFPDKPVRIFVLCQRAKGILASFFPSLAPSISVIPRYELFPMGSARAFPEKGSDWEIIFSGRFSSVKNLALLFHVVSELQLTHGEKVRLKLVGEFCHTPVIVPWRPKVHEKVSDQIPALMDELEWTMKPELIFGEDTESWASHLGTNSVIISLSDGFAEDFGVSIAQAQQSGTPVIASDIGGHGDLLGENVMLIPSHLIHQPQLSSLLDNWNFHSTRAKKIAAFITARNFIKRPAHFKTLLPSLVTPRVSTEELRELNRAGFWPQHGYKYYGERFSERSDWSFWNRYYQSWCGRRPPVKTMVLVTQTSWPYFSIATQAPLTYWFSEIQAGADTVFYRTDNLQGMKAHLAEVESVVFVGLYDREVEIAKFIRAANPEIKFIIYAFEHPSMMFAYQAVQGLTEWLRPHDEILVAPTDLPLAKIALEGVSFGIYRLSISERVRGIPFSQRHGEMKLFYAGRISPQKGLHHLLWAISLMKTPVKLELVGDEDTVGNRHLGIGCENYKSYLQELAHALGIASQVEFRGPLLHEELLKEAARRKLIFISTSFHVDENYNLFLRDGLTHGCPAIATSWGGNREFKSDFPRALKFIPVHHGKVLMIHPQEIGQVIESAIKDFQNYEMVKSPPRPAVEHGKTTPASSPRSSEKRMRLIEKKNSRRGRRDLHIYDWEEDQEILSLFRELYGSQRITAERSDSTLMLTPWCKVDTARITLSDPNLPAYVIPRTGERQICLKNHSLKEDIILSLEEAKILRELGQIFSYQKPS